MSPTIAFTIITFFLLYSINSLTHSHGFKITTRLIHRDSIHSPLYNASLTTEDRAKRAVRSSLARHAYLSTLSSKDTPSGIEAGLVVATEYYLFYVNFSIGQPPVPQLAVMDTGSEMLWVKCLPCFPCSPISGVTLFDPLKSKTYFPRPCTRNCMKCTVSKCLYTTEYYRHSIRSEGEKATEQLTFRTYNDSTTVIPNVTFGCSHLMTGLEDPDQRLTGVLGLAVEVENNFKNLLTEVGPKFSYCVSSLYDLSYPYNCLSFGDAVDFPGRGTPFYLRNGLYHLHLVNISLDWQVLFKKMTLRKGVILDTGSTLSYLYTEAFDVMKAKIRKLAGRILQEVPPLLYEPYELCYRGVAERDAQGFLMRKLMHTKFNSMDCSKEIVTSQGSSFFYYSE
ncbi:Probable aspartic protease At2g35615 [Linum perenne]